MVGMNNMSIEYLAGFFDGEGSVSIIKSAKTGRHSMSYVLRVTVSGTNPAPLRAFMHHFGGGIYSKTRYSENHSQGYDWVITCERAGKFLEEIAPLLFVKREEAEVGLEFQRAKGSHSSTRRVPMEALHVRETLRNRLVALHGKASRTAKEA